MRNFGPYRGLVEVDFPAKEAGPLVLFHGQNMHGKTSFLNAIRWCLYGKALGREKKRLTSLDLLNYVARDANDFVFSVEGTFEVENEAGEQREIFLSRTCQPKKGVDRPSSSNDFTEALEIRDDGAVKARAQYDDYVNQFLPEDISRFFLFDGELLGEYEELVRSKESEQARKVKLAIEHVLGVPAAKNALSDFEKLEREASKKYDEEAKKSEEAKEAATSHAKVEKKIERKVKERDALREKLDRAEGKRSQLLEDLGKTEHLKTRASEIEGFQQRLKEESVRQDAFREKIKVLSSDVWRDVLRTRVDQEIESLGAEQGELAKADLAISLTSEQIRETEQALEKKRCPTCGSTTNIDGKQEVALNKRLSHLRRNLARAEKGFDSERLKSINSTIATLRNVVPAGVATGILAEEKGLDDSVEDSMRIRRKMEREVSLMKGEDPARVNRFQDQLRDTDREIGKIQGLLEGTETEIEELEADRKKLDDEMRKHETAGLEVLRIRKDLLSGCIEMMRASLDDLVDTLREEVERKATEFFLGLTTDESYKGLQINQNYGLTIIGARKKPIPVRSAGAENIVAFSLIAALQELSFQQAPVIMDTPVGRLDEKHREGVLDLIPSLGDQVMLLVHDGELKRGGRLYDRVASQIAAEKEIRHEKSEESTIEDLT